MMYRNIEQDYLVFDLETQRDIFSVGGRNHLDKLKISVGVVWDSRTDKFYSYYEENVDDLIKHLMCGALVVGFNHIYFDYQVLAGYKKEGTKEEFIGKLLQQPNFDMLIDIKERLGHLVSLDSLVVPTLRSSKSASGLQALDWYRQYQETQNKKFLKKIEKYCIADVQLTRDLYAYGYFNNKVMQASKNGNIQSINVAWKKNRTTLEHPEVIKEQVQLKLF